MSFPVNLSFKTKRENIVFMGLAGFQISASLQIHCLSSFYFCLFYNPPNTLIFICEILSLSYMPKVPRIGKPNRVEVSLPIFLELRSDIFGSSLEISFESLFSLRFSPSDYLKWFSERRWHLRWSKGFRIM